MSDTNFTFDKKISFMKDNTDEIEKRILENGVKKTFTGSLEQGKRDQLCLYLAGETYKNAYIELINQTYRNKILYAYIFESLNEVRSVTAEFVRDYNYERPHDSLGGLSPVMWKNGQSTTFLLYLRN